MKEIFILIILIVSINCFSQTQAEMNQQSYEELHQSNKTLNEIYQTIITEYTSDTIFIKNLKRSQRLWIQFRDAQIEMKYPEYVDKLYGSIHPTCRVIYQRELTQKRIATLNNWLSGTEEGDVCNGSVKIISNIDPQFRGKAFIEKDGLIWLNANMKRDHRIFGYKEKDICSEKMILLSVFTNEVENNPFDCQYGAYYDTSGMKEISLKYISTEGDFLKVAVIKKDKKLDEIYMLKNWFEIDR
ncbi:DUF1311 domain-containing protein [Gillisia sp. M10.2A]|uniref:DUF1311 domain-containing protein n=1 Tax=Gillisia lutea TaxID=2909668 RepID=A0ABS9EG76_9FLAO|nr:lysozyme inhibitor LprI family protein [Gillisia lutea]MCF4101899.1 DUF1311 domain-containing protein [Gillisia lutea]